MRSLLNVGYSPSWGSYWRGLRFLHKPGASEVEKVALNYYLKDVALSWWRAPLHRMPASKLWFSVTHPSPGVFSLAPPSRVLSLFPIRWSHLASERKVLHTGKTLELSMMWAPWHAWHDTDTCLSESSFVSTKMGLISARGARRM